MSKTCHHQTFTRRCRWCISKRRVNYGRYINLRNRNRYMPYRAVRRNALLPDELTPLLDYITEMIGSVRSVDSGGLCKARINTVAPLFKIGSKTEIEKEWRCSVCLLDSIKHLRQTRCKHTFHDHCIATWFSLNTSCPLCRYEFSR